MSAKVEFKEVSLNEKDFTILEGLSFSLEDRKIVGLIGRNGAGKTSLLSLLASYRLAAKGQVLIDGEEAFENQKKMEQVIFIYPDDYSEETETVRDTMDLIARYQNNYDENYAAHLIERFKLPLDKKVNQLSKGLQSAMNVTLGLASRAPVTIFDEAYLSMDAPSREVFYKELLKDQENHPRLVLLSTHLVSEAEYLFDEVLILHQGRVLAHENYDSFVSKGLTVTGSADLVDPLTEGYQKLTVKELGKVKAVTVYGQEIDQLAEEAARLDVEISSVSLQTLFNHLTEGEGSSDE